MACGRAVSARIESLLLKAMAGRAATAQFVLSLNHLIM
jgi:hypothetical protein